MKTRPHNILFEIFSAKFRTLSILFFGAFISFGALAQLCATSVVPPAVVNGVTVTSTSTGGVGTYPTAFTSCAYTTPANSMYFGFGGAFTYTFLFSQPVNNVVFVMTAAGQPGNEEFSITTNSGIPTIVDLGSCFTTIVGNTIFSGLGSGPMGGGGIFEIVGTGSYTSLTISGPGGLAGSLFALCENSVVPNPSGVTSTDASCFGACDGTADIVPGNLPPYSYLWDAAAGNSTSSSVAGLCAGTYTVQVTDGAGTVEVLSVTIDQPTQVQGTITAQTNVLCAGNTTGSVTISASGGTGPYTYDIGSGPSASGTFSALGAGNYTVTILDAEGCSATVPITITEPTQLTLDLLNQTDATCPSNDNGSIEVQASGGTAPYTYTINGGGASGSGLYQNLIPGTYTLSVTDLNGCSVSADFTLIGSPLIAATETVVNESCIGDCSGSIDIVTSQGTAPFSFSIDNCTTLLPSGTFTDLCTGTYAICVVDANGCLYNATVVVETETPPSNPAMTPIDPLCLNDDPVAIDAVDAGVFSGNGVVGTNFIPQLAGPGTHTITNLVSADCGGVATMDVIVYPLPTVSFEADVVSGCSPLEVAFNSTGDPVVSYQWSFGDGFHTDNSANVDYTFVEPGYYDVLLIATDANGCTNSANYSNYIHALEDPIADFSFEPSKPTTMNPLVSFNNLSSGSTQWEWAFDTLGTATTSEPTFMFPDETGAYMITLIAISSDGCYDTIRKPLLIHPEPLVFVPNTFTPDGNEFNQTFSPSIDGIDSYHYHLTIFNRWGELIFESFDPAFGWDGTYKGRVAQEGTYNWHIVLDEIYSAIRTEFYGTVLLMR